MFIIVQYLSHINHLDTKHANLSKSFNLKFFKDAEFAIQWSALHTVSSNYRLRVFIQFSQKVFQARSIQKCRHDYNSLHSMCSKF